MQDTLFAVTQGLTELTSELAAETELEALPALAHRLRANIVRLLACGLDGLAASHLISACYDQLTASVVELTAQRHRLPDTEWCWLALGSEGRQEQTLLTDQDNGLVFNALDAAETGAMRTLFLPFAQEVNQRLAACGFVLCKGRIMAGNPEWCLSLAEWRSRFIDWVRMPEPTALLNASIFFDLRPLHGVLTLGDDLRTLILSLSRETPAFLHLMGANALQAVPPLNFRGNLRKNGDECIDLKKYASRIFVDAARIFALSGGVRATHTGERLKSSGEMAGMQPGEIDSMLAAFSQSQRLRLAVQCEAGTRETEEWNCVQPSRLHALDQVILRELLKHAQSLQQRIKLNYAL